MHCAVIFAIAQLSCFKEEHSRAPYSTPLGKETSLTTPDHPSPTQPITSCQSCSTVLKSGSSKSGLGHESKFAGLGLGLGLEIKGFGLGLDT